MTQYQAPLREMRFALGALDAFGSLRRIPAFEHVDEALAEAVLAEAGRWAERKLAPLAALADRRGTELLDGGVRVPPEIRDAYREFADAGWTGLTARAEIGGQGLPQVIGTAASETWKAANLAFSLCPMLSQGAAEAIDRHAGDEVKTLLLPRLVSGEWTGTMNLTEPQAGSDLAAIETRAEPDRGHYRLRGRKIFITWGDHDMSANIVHLVLARTPGGPPGVKGLSMFAVPKRLIGADGSLEGRNDVVTVGLEHKLGIRGSPTCTLSYGEREGALGYLIGAEHEGLRAMFTMMNRARLAVGVEGLAVAERAYQDAFAFARERVQGRLPGRAERTTIIHHPDVRRMLMTMRASIDAMRGLAYYGALTADLAEGAAEPSERCAALARLGVLTPIVKGWCTEVGQVLASMGLQIHGGMGYIEETGVAQWLRDARITTIYEGTTGIQAADLVGRKLLDDDGEAVGALLAEIDAFLGASDGPRLAAETARGLEAALGAARRAVDLVLRRRRDDPQLPGAAAVNLLMLLGTLLGGWLLARAARQAQRQRGAEARETAAFLDAKPVIAAFYAQHLLPQTQAYLAAIGAGSESLMALSEEQLAR